MPSLTTRSPFTVHRSPKKKSYPEKIKDFPGLSPRNFKEIPEGRRRRTDNRQRITDYYERKFKRRGFELVAGVDEAGRGPLAGPVLACALVLNKFSFKERIDDSKRLSFSQRKRAYQEIIQNSVFGVGSVGEKEVDELNIQRATLRAMEMAMFNLISRLNQILKKEIFPSTCAPLGICFLIDGTLKPEVDYHCENIIGGDNKSLSIACASIVAKVRRDDIMCDYHRLYPEYGFTRHKGYATAEHREAISEFGQSPIHRRSFRVNRRKGC